MIKVTLIFYDDLQHQSSDSTSLALPFEDDKLTKAKSQNLLNLTLNDAQIRDTTVNNRTVISNYREYVKMKNREQFMQNKHFFSSTRTRYILLVQVHTRVVYLRQFIERLKNIQGISETLVIFSHDFIDPDINQLVTNITFVPVMKY